MKKTLRTIALVILGLIGIILVQLFVIRPIVALVLTRSPEYVYRIIFWGESDIYDYQKFPYREVLNAPPTFHFKPVSFPEAFQPPEGFGEQAVHDLNIAYWLFRSWIIFKL